MSVRLSYHDVKLFLRIFESAQRQIDKAIEKPESRPTESEIPPEIEDNGSSEDAMLITQKAIYTENTSLALESSSADKKSQGNDEEGKGSSLAGVEVKNSFKSCWILSLM